MAALRRRERQPLEENLTRQWAGVERLLGYAWAHSPFHRQRMEAVGAAPEAIRRPEDLTQIPALTRGDIKQNLRQLCSDEFRFEDLLAAATGGTTDTPVPLRREPQAVARREAVQQMFWEWAGVQPGAKVFWLWGAQSDFPLEPNWKWRLYDRGLMRREWAATAPLDSTVFEGYRQRLNRFRPEAVCAYPTPLFLFCEYLRDCGLPVHRPRAVICTAEALLPHQRPVIEAALGAPVYVHYGSRDSGMVAAECEAHAGLHLHTEACYLEFVPLAGGDGTVREILLTDLTNYAMPLIRYRIGDCVLGGAPPAACACGRGLPLLPPIAGRTTDTFRLPDGRMVPGVALTNRVIQEAPALAKTQIVQETLRDFRVRYVPAPGFTPRDLEPLQRKLVEFLGSDVRWQFEAVEEIEREANGKTRFCISHLSGAGAGAAASPQGTELGGQP
ncbi:MAG TPA: hypothetical protein VN690_01910 [Terriglobales bacterium]|nr:hypothetical protein [Terriglobales bacterium]